MKNKELRLSDIKPALIKTARSLGRYGSLGFFLLVAAIYGFVLLRINLLSNQQPSDSDISAQAAKVSAIPRIDPQVAQKLQSLKDNSVNVKTLFDQARDNPFNE